MDLIKRTIVFTLPFLFGVFSGTAIGKTWTVKQAGGGDFVGIMSAVNSASNGDVINVSPGTYVEQVTISGKSVKLIAVEGPTKTKITGAPKLIFINPTPAAGALVEGFALEGASEGAMHVIGATVTVRGCIFSANGSAETDGAGLQVTSSPNVYVENNEFVGNTAKFGTLNAIGSVVSVNGNVFRGNSAVAGGAIYADQASKITISQSLFCDNTATENGGAIWMQTSTLQLTSGLFVNNAGTDGGGFYLNGVTGVAQGPSVVLQNVTYVSGDASNAGALVYGKDTSVELLNTLLYDDVPSLVATEGESAEFTATYSAYVGAAKDVWVKNGVPNATDPNKTLLLLDNAEAAGLRGPYEGQSCVLGAYEPLPTSVLINAGTQKLKDLDKTRSDIGAYGGPDGLAPTVDTDSDKHPDLLDNCPEDKNADQKDTDGDGLGDVCDETSGVTDDQDVDGIKDVVDNCPVHWNPPQDDTDNDGVGDTCDLDDDNDGSPDLVDCAPLDSTRGLDLPELCNGIDDDCDSEIDEFLGCQAEPDPDALSEQDLGSPDVGGVGTENNDDGGGDDGGCHVGQGSRLRWGALWMFFATVLVARRRLSQTH